MERILRQWSQQWAVGLLIANDDNKGRRANNESALLFFRKVANVNCVAISLLERHAVRITGISDMIWGCIGSTGDITMDVSPINT